MNLRMCSTSIVDSFYELRNQVAALNNSRCRFAQEIHDHIGHTGSSRQLAGYPLTSYTKAPVTFSDLSVQDVERMEKDGEVDAWVMALPNGICKPFVDAIDRGTAERKDGKGSVIVDLSADYRFEDGWTYGLPGEAPSL
ncbi:hypothetical protein NUW54_g12138 [Trametes sanguinea]|uniref:Uncharacterized protein n=1 Tax=Trametes sanguinea TaxID=158606 RepID=A0ACC1N234_9APHY|nr:hypothetical protein NUW54_g12138 [Trametes sanguinea]